MLRNYLKIAIRTFLKNKSYALINILGLSIGITCATMILFYVDSELSHDQFHSKKDRIYRIIETNHSNPDNIEVYGQTSPPVAEAMTNDIAGVEDYTSVYQLDGHIDMVWKGEKIQERSWIIAQNNFLEIFDFELVKGDRATALKEPNSILLSESAAIQYFGDENPMGQLMDWKGFDQVKVTGVVKDVSDYSHIQFKILFSYNTALDNQGLSEFLKSWDNYGAFSYLLLDKNTSVASVKDNFPKLIDKYLPENDGVRNFDLQPISDIYFQSENIKYGISESHGNKFYVNLFIGIAIFILIVVSINYVNLSTAKSTQRSKEIGIRKISGATQYQLVFQFLTEAVILALLSFVLSVLLIEIMLPYFNEIASKNFALNSENLIRIGTLIFSITIMLGIIAGIYPALIVARFKPIESLKGTVKSESMTLRGALIVVQFTISIVMLASAMIVYNQMNFIKNKSLGFDQENLLIVDINNAAVRKNFKNIKYEMLQVSGVKSVATSSRVPGEWKNIREVTFKSHQSAADSMQSYFMCFDEDMIETYSFQMKKGNNFAGNRVVDSTKVILNESAVKAFNLENPVGKYIYLSSRQSGPMQVIGVVEDFNFQSLHKQIAPLVLGYWSNPVTYIDYFSIKLSTANFPETLAGIKAIHDKFDLSTAMEYHFLDNQINSFYVNDQRVGNLLGLGAIVMLIIAGFGLFGITSYMLEKRKKEIGVRKVLGSSLLDLMVLFFSSYGRQVLISFLLATPIAYYFALEWSNLFSYQQDISALVFLLAGLIVMLFTFLTVGYRVINAARLNPVDVLKDE